MKMTYVNVTVPTMQEISQFKGEQLLKRECDFWEDQTRDLQRRLENIFDHVAKTGHVELWHRGDKIDLYVKGATAPAEAV
jgi:hypothetical protein